VGLSEYSCIFLTITHTKQELQCTYNVTLFGVRATIVAVEKQ